MVFDRRRHLRYDFSLVIEYVKDHGVVSPVYQGIITDISNSGLRLLTPSPLDIGEAITIKNTLPAYSQTAVVRWVENPDSASYSAGLEFDYS
jgi:hypothetical protein